jgi:hypothetical protein
MSVQTSPKSVLTSPCRPNVGPCRSRCRSRPTLSVQMSVRMSVQPPHVGPEVTQSRSSVGPDVGPDPPCRSKCRSECRSNLPMSVQKSPKVGPVSVQMSVQTHPVGPNVGPTSPCRSRSHPKSVQCRSRCRSRPAMSVQTSFPVILVSLTSCMSVSGHVICLSLYPGHHNSPLLKFRHLPLMTSSSLRENDTSQCSMTYLVSK